MKHEEFEIYHIPKARGEFNLFESKGDARNWGGTFRAEDPAQFVKDHARFLREERNAHSYTDADLVGMTVTAEAPDGEILGETEVKPE